MRTPEKAYQMMKMTVASADVPVSVKMRMGYDKDHINVIELSQMAESAGISSVTVHGRTREQQYSGEADWEIIARVKESVHIPVCGNGDLFTPEQAISKQAMSHTDAVMIGRGAMGNPWIFREIKSLLRNGIYQPVTKEEKHRMIMLHYRRMLEEKPEPIAVREMRKHIGWYIKGINGAARFRNEINLCTDARKAMGLIDELFKETPDNHPADRE